METCIYVYLIIRKKIGILNSKCHIGWKLNVQDQNKTNFSQKVTMAAEVASSDLVLDEYVDEDVSAVFQSVLRDNLPYVNIGNTLPTLY